MNWGCKAAAVMLICGAVLGRAQLFPSHAPTAASPRVVARVNGVPITEQDVSDQVTQLYPPNVHGGLPPDRERDIRRAALDELVMQELVWRRAQKAGTVVSMTETQHEYARVRAGYGEQAFDRTLEEHHITTEQYLTKLQRELTIRREVARHVDARSAVGESDVRLYYEQHRGKFLRPERVHARMILIRLDRDANAQAEDDARHMAESLCEQLKSGKDFAELAAQYSDDMSRASGGDIGWIHRGTAAPELERAVFALSAGQFSPPLRIPEGFAVLKAEAHEPERQLTYQEVRVGLKFELEQKRREEVRRAWLAELKKGAQIEIVDGTTTSKARPAAN